MSEKAKVGHPLAVIPEFLLAAVILAGSIKYYSEKPENFRFILIALCASFVVKALVKIWMRYNARKNPLYGYSTELLYRVAAMVFIIGAFACSFYNVIDKFGWGIFSVACACGILSVYSVNEVFIGLKSPKAFEEKHQAEKTAKLAEKNRKEAEKNKQWREKNQQYFDDHDDEKFQSDTDDFDPDTGEVYYYTDRPRKKPEDAKRKLLDWERTLTPLWSGTEKIQFSYLSNKGDRTRRNVILSDVKVANNGNLYLLGFCHLRNEERTFEVSRIRSKIFYHADGKKYSVDDFVTNVLGVHPSILC